MNYLKRMYNGSNHGAPSTKNKNPNRVTGGLKSQGVDRLTMISEDGTQREIPTLEYVRSLEEQVKRQRAAITVLERKLSRQDSEIQALSASIKRL